MLKVNLKIYIHISAESAIKISKLISPLLTRLSTNLAYFIQITGILAVRSAGWLFCRLALSLDLGDFFHDETSVLDI